MGRWRNRTFRRRRDVLRGHDKGQTGAGKGWLIPTPRGKASWKKAKWEGQRSFVKGVGYVTSWWEVED